MDLTDFSCNDLNKLLKNISQTQKLIFSLGDFNITFFSYNEHNQTNDFLGFLASNYFIPLTLQPTRITSHVTDLQIISGNSTTTISDDLPQFSIVPKMSGNI